VADRSIPKDVQCCPACASHLWLVSIPEIYPEGCETVSAEIECSTFPGFDSPDYSAWISAHWAGLSVEQYERVLAWLKRPEQRALIEEAWNEPAILP
jgi:hypothetical protein